MHGDVPDVREIENDERASRKLCWGAPPPHRSPLRQSAPAWTIDANLRSVALANIRFHS